MSNELDDQDVVLTDLDVAQIENPDLAAQYFGNTPFDLGPKTLPFNDELPDSGAPVVPPIPPAVVGAVLGAMPSWARNIWGGVHYGGALVLNIFGQKKLSDSLTKLEDNAGMLPQWAGGTPPKGPPMGLVDKPEHVVLVAADGTSSVVDADQVVIYGSPTRVDGNGYQSGGSPDDGLFSFGYDGGSKPLNLTVVSGTQKANASVRGVLFLGGAESAVAPTVKPTQPVPVAPASSTPTGAPNRAAQISLAAAQARQKNAEQALAAQQAQSVVGFEKETTMSEFNVLGEDTLVLGDDIINEVEAATFEVTGMQPKIGMQPKDCPALVGLDILGAAGAAVAATRVPTPRAGFVFKQAPGKPAGKGVYTSLVVNKPKHGDSKASIANARDAGKRAVSIGTQLASKLKTAKIPVALKSRLQKVAALAVKHGSNALKGAAKYEAGVNKEQARLATGAARAAKSSMIGADFEVVVGTAGHWDEIVGEAGHWDEIVGNRLRGEEVEVLGMRNAHPHAPDLLGDASYAVDIVGEYTDLDITGIGLLSSQYSTAPDPSRPGYLMNGQHDPSYVPVAAAVPTTSLPNPSNPGYLMNGQIDPNYGAAAAVTAATQYATAAMPIDPNNPPNPSSPGYLMDGEPDPNYGLAGTTDPTFGLGPAPTTAPPLVPGSDYAPDPGIAEDTTAYSSDTSKAPGAPIPAGAIYFDGSKSFGNMDLGSFNYYTGGHGPGDILDNKASGISAPPKNGFVLNKGGWWGGGVHHGDGWMAVRGSNRMDSLTSSESGNATFSTWDDPTHNKTSPVHLQASSLHYNWGPLVGNPDPSKWTAGLRFDAGANKWFWYRDTAPKFATSADDMGRLNQAIIDYQAQLAAAAADAAAQAAQNKLDQAQADQINKAQAVQDAQMASQQAAQQAQIDMQQQASDAQDSVFATQFNQQRAQAQLKAEQDQAALQVQQQQFMLEHPDLMQQPDGGGGDDGGGQDDGGQGTFDPNSDQDTTAMADRSDDAIAPPEGADSDAYDWGDSGGDPGSSNIDVESGI